MTKTGHPTLTSHIALVTVSDAIRLRKTCHFPHQRTIRDLNVQRLGVEMEKGRFIQGTPVFFAVLPDGTQYIVNGNHTLEAIAYSGKPQVLTLIFLKVADLDEAAALYATFDLHKARTWMDALKASGRDQSVPMAKQVTYALKLIMSNFRSAPENVEANSSRASRFEVMEDYQEAAELLHGVMKGAPLLNTRIVTRAAVFAVALETVRHQPLRGVQFWQGVVQDNGIENGDPRKTLLRWLLTHTVGLASDKALMSRCCAHAWNAWWRGQTLTVLRPPSTGGIVLLGTPWDGKKGLPPTKGGTPPKGSSPKGTGPTPKGGVSEVLDMFETGVLVTEAGTEEVLRYRGSANGATPREHRAR